ILDWQTPYQVMLTNCPKIRIKFAIYLIMLRFLPEKPLFFMKSPLYYHTYKKINVYKNYHRKINLHAMVVGRTGGKYGF
ncbi:hypothetical protein, partial [Levilactobacillus brevis]|uniref:hypothetical protein n=1 Tax=Levilactobacillus brevis TaxID=1580 RepID=UPI001BA7ECDE